MAVIQYDEYKQKLIALEPTLADLEAALDLNGAKEELMKLQAEAEADGYHPCPRCLK